jgi:hypothetical protein
MDLADGGTQSSTGEFPATRGEYENLFGGNVEQEWIHQWLETAAFYHSLDHPANSPQKNWAEAVNQLWAYCIFHNIDIPASALV